MAHNVRQVYYVPYPPTLPRKRGWSVAIKINPRGRIETEEPNEAANEEVAYQADDMTHVNEIIEVDQVTGWRDSQVEGDQVDPSILEMPNEVEDENEDVVDDNNEGDQQDKQVYDGDVDEFDYASDNNT